MNDKAILLSGDSYAAFHKVRSTFGLNLVAGQGANKMIFSNSLNL
jgi:hypothetical protein